MLRTFYVCGLLLGVCHHFFNLILLPFFVKNSNLFGILVNLTKLLYKQWESGLITEKGEKTK
jgi:hypothetical protein